MTSVMDITRRHEMFDTSVLHCEVWTVGVTVSHDWVSEKDVFKLSSF